MKLYVLDACALIAFFNEENGADKVEHVFLHNGLCLMSIINVYEVCYDAAKMAGMDEGIRIYDEIQQLPIKIIKVIRKELLKEAYPIQKSWRCVIAFFLPQRTQRATERKPLCTKPLWPSVKSSVPSVVKKMGDFPLVPKLCLGTQSASCACRS